MSKETKIKKKPGRKPKKKLYFGQEVQDAIIRYNESTDDSERNKIYQQEIHKAFDKLCENIINTFKFTYFDDPFEDVKCEVVAFLVMNIHKYDHTKGAKAFSYFSVVAKNYLILHNNNNYKKLKSHDGLDAMDRKEYVGETNTFDDDFMKSLVEYFEVTIPKIFKKKRDITVAFSILELMKKSDDIENFNKKSLYILIREMANVETTYITKIVNVLRKHYKKVQNQYLSDGVIKMNKTKFF